MIITNPHLILWWMCDVVLVQVNQVCGKEEIYSACFQTIPLAFVRKQARALRNCSRHCAINTNAMGRKMIGHNLLPKNRTLLLMILLRCYLSYNFLSQLFGANTTTIHEKNWPCTIHNRQFWVDPLSCKRVSSTSKRRWAVIHTFIQNWKRPPLPIRLFHFRRKNIWKHISNYNTLF